MIFIRYTRSKETGISGSMRFVYFNKNRDIGCFARQLVLVDKINQGEILVVIISIDKNWPY
jgi:hypothetical protein